MELTQKEKQVLTLLDGIPKNRSADYILRYMKMSSKELEDTLSKLKKLKLIDILTIPQGDKKIEWFFHTKKVSSDMLEDNLRYEKDLANSESIYFAKNKLKEFQKDKKIKTMKLDLDKKKVITE